MGRILSSQPYFGSEEVENILAEIKDTLESGTLTQGPRVPEFETQFAALAGTRHAVAVSTGTSALEMILRFLCVEGAEVIVPTNTFLASANAVIFAGGKPVFADIDPDSLCVGLGQIQEQVTPQTRGIMVVHIAGLICPEIDAIRRFAHENGLFVIEDCAHAHGAEWGLRKAGSLSDAAAFSFFPTKPMTTGEGGMITTNNDELATFARTFRNHGVPEGKKVHQMLGHNHRLSEVGAILGLSQLRELPAALRIRRAIAERYREEFRDLPEVTFIAVPNDSLPSFYKYPLILPTREQRDAVAEALKQQHGIDSGTLYWPPCHFHPVVQERADLYHVRTPLSHAEDVLPRVLCIPVHARLETSTVDFIVSSVKAEIQRVNSLTPSLSANL